MRHGLLVRSFRFPGGARRVLVIAAVLALSAGATAAAAVNALPAVPVVPLGWSVNGAAQPISSGFQLTQAGRLDEAGSAFWATPVDLTTPVTIAFDATMNGGGVVGADGMTLVFADALHGGNPHVVGENASALGYGGIPGIAVALDTYKNAGEPASNFIGIANGLDANGAPDYLATNAEVPDLRAAAHHFQIDTTGNHLVVTMDGHIELSVAVALPASAFVGFTAANGGYTDDHVVTNISANDASGIGSIGSDGSNPNSTVAPATTSTGVSINNITYQPPIIITTGGTYSGNWESTSPNTPAVSIQTSSPVIIQNCNVKGKYDLIRTEADHTKVTVQNCHGYGENPGVVGQAPGRFFFAEKFDNVTIQNNYLVSTAGIRIATYAGNGTTDTVRILRNRSLNIDGRWSDGTGFSTGPTDFDRVAFVQLVDNTALPGAEIAWNEDINQPFNSRVEDNINMFETSGTSSAPILIHDNYIQGAYSALPEIEGFTGGGIDTDGPNGGTQWVTVYDNQVVSTSNYGIGIAAGANNLFYGNTVLSSGLLPNGDEIQAQNVGAIDWNAYSFGGFSSNVVRDNVIGWYRPASSTRSDTYFPDCPSTCTGNIALHGGGPVTLADEAAEKTTWDRKVAAAQVVIGPQ